MNLIYILLTIIAYSISLAVAALVLNKKHNTYPKNL